MSPTTVTASTPVSSQHEELKRWVGTDIVIAESWSEIAGNLIVVLRNGSHGSVSALTVEPTTYRIIRAWRRGLTPTVVAVSVDKKEATAEQAMKYLSDLR